jgi:hypothetical protein
MSQIVKERGVSITHPSMTRVAKAVMMVKATLVERDQYKTLVLKAYAFPRQYLRKAEKPYKLIGQYVLGLTITLK